MFKKLPLENLFLSLLVLSFFALSLFKLPAFAQNDNSFLEAFDGKDAVPSAYTNPRWDIAIHSRDVDTWLKLEPMEAMHGMNCSAPPAMHMTDGAYEDSVFRCADHLMTAIKAIGYGAIYLTPNAIADFSKGETVVSWDVSTDRMSLRDWWDVWITPYDENLQLPFDTGEVDLQGTPKDAIHVKLDSFNSQSTFRAYSIKNFAESEIEGCWYCTIEDALKTKGLTPDMKRREKFELHISKNHIKFGMPAYNYWPIDEDVSTTWGQGIVQIGHHSYNPEKDGAGTAATWHWDNVAISNSIPFTIIHADRRFVQDNTAVNFEAAAPANSNLRFSGVGKIAISLDGGKTWKPAVKQPSSSLETNYHAEHMSSYWTPIPEGTKSVKLSFATDDWYTGPFIAKDFTIWSKTGGVVISETPMPTMPDMPGMTTTPASPSPTLTPTPTPARGIDEQIMDKLGGKNLLDVMPEWMKEMILTYLNMSPFMPPILP